MSAAIIQDQLRKCGYRRDSDVSELYLGRKGLKEVADLSRFRMLRYLWLNHNKIKKITCLTNNYRLSELYLNNNELRDITGYLKHLTSLRILLLNDNYLTKLQVTVMELKGMTSLHTLNLFHNPLAQVSDYRLYVIHHLPSVQLLDREKVTYKEGEAAFKVYNPERTAVIQSLGFGRRADLVLTPKRPLVANSIESSATLTSGYHNVGNEHHRKNMGVPEKVIISRANQRSVMQFSYLDWNKVPPSRQKLFEDHPVQPHETILVELR
ncbi:leucine-rich repeat-containing protein 72 [Spea bombifrons]|uniref:leucine-rich repeat-containing protein 72 n=1 Tax=Spea bombifrons TaxID=233779 RepID=UPI00234A064E|nr:leucine-rich repeat-containing protein 72 [Spea bombifrons]